jgi:hypothetical protein
MKIIVTRWGSSQWKIVSAETGAKGYPLLGPVYAHDKHEAAAEALRLSRGVHRVVAPAEIMKIISG